MAVRVAAAVRGALLGAVLLAAAPARASTAAPEPAPAGSPLAERIHFQLAVYYLPVPSGDPMQALRRALEGKSRHKLADKAPERADGMQVGARMERNVPEKYRAPDLQSLQYFGRGLDRDQALALQGAQQALVLDFVHPSKLAWEGLRSAYEVVEAIAQRTGGLIWDEETREVFAAGPWRARLEALAAEPPEVAKHTVIHAYRSERGLVRAITLGMAKLGLPDVVVEDFSWSSNRSIGHLVNLTCQALAEGAKIGPAGHFELGLKSIRNAAVRDEQLRSLKSNAASSASLVLAKGRREAGDPENRLLEIRFDRYPGRDVHARQTALISALFGSEDSVVNVRHDQELLDASRRAKEKLPALREAFAAGLRPGEFIQVKAPFAIPGGGQEWMWVEVLRWSGEAIDGLLKNQPFHIRTLHAGQEVKVRQQDVFDYIRRFPDGREEGNETGAIIARMQERKAR